MKDREIPTITVRMGVKCAECGKGGGKDSPARIGTPIQFRDLLLAIARGETA
jgi:hypothetical protein